MKKQQKKTNKVLDSYKMPSKEILWHRNVFYGLWRRSDDKTTTWLRRVQNCIRRCEFLTNFTELLLIDRFVCGLNAKELMSFKRAKKSWTLENLLKHFSKESNDSTYCEVAMTVNGNVHQIENISLETVKLEPNEEDGLQNDPLNESKEGMDSLIDRKPTVDVIEEEVEESPEQIISSDGEETNLPLPQNEEIDYEILNNGMEFECEEYKFSVKNVATTVASTAIDAPVIETPAPFTISIDTIINNVVENLLNSPAEKEQNKNDQKKQHSIVSEAPKITEVAASTSSEASVPSDAAIVPVIDVSNNEGKENHSDSFTTDQPNENDQQKHSPKITNTSITINNSTLATDTAADTVVILDDDDDENLSNIPIEEDPNKNDNHERQAGTSAGIDVPVLSASSVSTGVTINDVDGNLSDSSVEQEPNKTDERRYYMFIVNGRNKRYACKQCDRSFNRPSKALFHIKTVHDGIRFHFCEQCGKGCTSKYELRIHSRSHTGERSFTCDQCGASYGYLSGLTSHKRSIHQGLRPHVCKICDKAFTMKALLTRHLAIHTSEKLFMCDECGKAFSTSKLLETHKKRIHERILPHACEICDKRFYIAATLRKHSRIHTGERPYPCDQCDKSFAQTGALNLHKVTVHEGTRPHACPQCDKRFKTPTHLKQHLTIHTGEKRYTCDQCNKSFALGHHLSSHKKSVHQQKP